MKKTHFFFLFFLLYGKIAFAQQPYIGEIRIFAGNFAPAGWAFCDGSPLPISEYEALFQLIGTTYGGDGQDTFALPDLRGRVPVHIGSGPGLTNVVQGETFGVEQLTLTSAQIPSHTHESRISVSNTNANLAAPTTTSNLAKMGSLSGRAFIPALSYTSNPPNTPIENAKPTSSVGAFEPISIMKPYLGVNYIISLYGIFPIQN